MTDIERSAIKTYLWWKNRYDMIKDAQEGNDIYSIFSGSPQGGFCSIGESLGVPADVLSDCANLETAELTIRRVLKEGRKDPALIMIRTALDVYRVHLEQYLGADFIDRNKGVFTWH